MTAPFLRTLGVALALPLLLAACLFPSLTRPSGWETSETFNQSYDDVWETVLEAVKQDGNRWVIVEADKDDGTIETKWRYKNLIREATRRRMEVEIVSGPEGEGYAVKVRVFRERVFAPWQDTDLRPANYDVAKAHEADWRWDGFDERGPSGLFDMIRPTLADD